MEQNPELRTIQNWSQTTATAWIQRTNPGPRIRIANVVESASLVFHFRRITISGVPIPTHKPVKSPPSFGEHTPRFARSIPVMKSAIVIRPNMPDIHGVFNRQPSSCRKYCEKHRTISKLGHSPKFFVARSRCSDTFPALFGGSEGSFREGHGLKSVPSRWTETATITPNEIPCSAGWSDKRRIVNNGNNTYV